MRNSLLAGLLALGAFAGAQSVDVGKQVYASAENSVFLVYLNDSTGAPSALGSAFIVRPHILITNAHVADAGEPVLAVGPVRVPLKVVRVDRVHDLAELTVNLDLVSKPLVLSDEKVRPGELIFAIGNPEGLEKSISQGIVSGLRKEGDKDLIQISSPISHGSSGGPVLNDKGEVVGVAVAMLGSGQNLNFAVPVEYVRALLDPKPAGVPAQTALSSLDHVIDLVQQKKDVEYSADADSQYQKLTALLQQAGVSLLNETNDPSTLRTLACLGVNQWDLIDTGVNAARKLAKIKQGPESQALLAYLLDSRANIADFSASLSKDGSDEQKQNQAIRDSLFSEALATARTATPVARGDTLLLVDYVLGDAHSSRGNLNDAIAMHTHAASGNLQVCDHDLTKEALQGLIRENTDANHPDEAEKWFRTYAAKYTPAAYEWDLEGDRRANAGDQVKAAEAYETAARSSQYYVYDYCYAAKAQYLRDPTNEDAVLADGKLCTDANAKNTNKSQEGYFKDSVPAVYTFMAQVLRDRGAYQPAMEYVKEAISMRPDYSYALGLEADIYYYQERYSECETVENEAIRTSNGKYPYMQFRLGTCFFAQGNYSRAENAFRIAANADKTDAPAAFNLALSLERQGIGGDSQIWYKEALKRSPDSELRAKILNAIR